MLCFCGPFDLDLSLDSLYRHLHCDLYQQSQYIAILDIGEIVSIYFTGYWDFTMVWGSSSPKEPNASPPPELDAPVTRGKLPAKLQQLVDRDDDFYDDLYSP